jgi:ribosome-binding factor A
VTKVELDETGREASVFVSVYPDEKAHGALDFLNRNVDDFKRYVRSQLKMHDIPRYRFVQDPNIAGVGEAVPVE